MKTNQIDSSHRFAWESYDGSSSGCFHIIRQNYSLHNDIRIIKNIKYLCGKEVSAEIQLISLEALISKEWQIDKTFCPKCKNILHDENPSYIPFIKDL